MIMLNRPSPGQIASGFGMRDGRMHYGVDFSWMRPDRVQDWNIYAAAAGTIVHAGPMGSFGNLTILDHGDEIQTYYAHQARFALTRGDVDPGKILGTIGGSGASGANTYDPHLHFELRIRGNPVDPMLYFTGAAGVDPTSIRRRKMTTLYREKDAKPARWALGGEAPGTSANWIETSSSSLASNWEKSHGPSVDLIPASFASFRDRYLEPLKIAGSGPPPAASGEFTFTGTATPA